MEVEFKTLENCSTDELLNCFNLAFSDYSVPMHLNADVFGSKIKTENIRLDYSAGAFLNNRLIGFILHGYDNIEGEKHLYNGGTGIITSERGQKLTKRLYEFVLPLLKEKQIKKVQLEVLTNNLPAIRTYQQIGFLTTRKLNCYKGDLHPTHEEKQIHETKSYDWNELKTFWDYTPTWQNSINAVERAKDHCRYISIQQNGHIIAYLVYNTKTKRVQQFAVNRKFRQKGLGSSLFNSIAMNYDASIAVINVDEESDATTSFMQKLGLKIYVQQYEMELML